MKVNQTISLEKIHHVYQDITKFYRGRPEMIVMKMINGRNIQFFRGGTVQVLGRVSDIEAERMRAEFIEKLSQIEKMENFQVTEWILSNLVLSVRLKKSICLQKIKWTNADIFHEIELFPAILIRKWYPVHIAMFHTGKIVLTGVTSFSHFYDIMNSLICYLRKAEIIFK
jgi:TATA-box binding protein (TBP) (component of TFIID and TFIIIB)